MFCVVRALHKFDFRLVINETPHLTNGDGWKVHSLIEIYAGSISMFFLECRHEC